jgi:hypothetical protein
MAESEQANDLNIFKLDQSEIFKKIITNLGPLLT